MIEKRGGSGEQGWGGRGGMSKKCVSKCNQNVNIPYCGEYLSVNSG